MKLLSTGRAGRYGIPALLAVLTAFAGCGSDRTSAPRLLGSIHITSGEAQHGTPGARLPDPIVITIRSDSGHPVPGVAVQWIADDGGAIEMRYPVTDSLGRAIARWTLGANGGIHTATARANGYAPLTVTAVTPRLSPLPSDDIHVLGLSTYDGSNETVHPDYALLPSTWPRELRDYLAITPYPNADITYENPSLYESSDLVGWTPPDGMSNPIVPAPLGGHLSDPDIVFDPDRNELMLYYREVVNDNAIYVVRSPNAVIWSAPTLVARGGNHSIVSPSIVRRSEREWMMWSVNAGIGCGAESASLELRRSTDGLQWSGPVGTSLSPRGMYPWHVDVQWIEELGEYWALFNAKPAFSCTTTRLYLATSRDGVRWTTLPTPILEAGAIPEFAHIVYRATFSYDRHNDAVTFWYSGARYNGSAFVWSSAVQQRNRLDVLSHASEPRIARSAAAATQAVPPLIDPP
jgi:hypothetical protein